MKSLREAAIARAEGVAAPADRPRQRRCAEEQGSGPRVSARVRNMTLRAKDDDATLEFQGYATVYERGYEMWDFWGPYTEIVSAGAGSSSLARADLDVPLVLQHQDLRRIARTTNGTLVLTEEDEGLRVLAPGLDPTDEDVRYIVPKLRSGLVDEMSFKFQITSGHWSPDYTEYRIDNYDIHRGDVAIVGYGANPFTAGSGLRAHDARNLVRELPEDAARAALDELRSRLEPAAPRNGAAERRQVLITEDDTRLLPLV